MPPRYAYWTILVDGQPTAFRAAMQEDLMPTFKRLKDKHPTAEMKWFQNGKLWNTRLDAQDAMQERGERGRMGDKRQGGGFRDRKRSGGFKRESFEDRKRASGFDAPEPDERNDEGKLDWKPKGEFTPAPKRERPNPSDWKPKGDWKPKRFPAERSEARRGPQREGGHQASRASSRYQDRRPPRPSTEEKLEWKPKGQFTPAPKRADRAGWKPKADWKKERFPPKARETRPGSRPPSEGARRDKNWRPGGEHKDPRQKYKDAKKAKWTKFKANVRQRWEKKQGDRPAKKPAERAPRKKRDEE